MIKSRFSLKALGLCALVLGLMAFTTSAAQAEPGATWTIIKASGLLLPIPNGVEDLLPQAQSTLENSTGSLLFTTKGGTKVEILCTAVELVEGGKLIAEGGLSLGRARFTGCITKLNSVLSKNCEPHTGASKGVIETLKATGLLVLHELKPSGVKDLLLKLSPDLLLHFANIELSELCAIGEKVPVEGHLYLKDCLNDLSTHLVEHLFEEGPLTSLTALGQPATIDGSILVRLVGAHLGLKWAGLA